MQTTIRKPVRNKQINIRATDEERAANEIHDVVWVNSGI